MPGSVRGVIAAQRARDAQAVAHFGCGTIRIYGFGDFQPCG